MTLNDQRADVKILFALTLVHFIGDFYNSFIIPLLPLFIAKYSLTLTQAGLIVGLSRFLAFIFQSPVGYMADRYPTRLFALGGTLSFGRLLFNSIGSGHAGRDSADNDYSDRLFPQ